MNARRFRWLPRFSIGNLLMLMVVVGLCLAWYDQRRKLGKWAEVIEKQRLEIVRLTVNCILRSDMTDVEKAREVGAYIRLGDRLENIQTWCGRGEGPDGDGIGPLTFWPDCDLAVSCDENGFVCGFGYYKPQYVDGRRPNSSLYTELGVDAPEQLPSPVQDEHPTQSMP